MILYSIIVAVSCITYTCNITLSLCPEDNKYNCEYVINKSFKFDPNTRDFLIYGSFVWTMKQRKTIQQASVNTRPKPSFDSWW